jgi:GNAT superfamily N-acetyltransferase
LDFVADDDPPSLEELARYAHAGRSWVAVSSSGGLIGYVIFEEVDDNAHIEQITVRPDEQGRGVGRALLDRVVIWASETGHPAITLTTYAEVPWNQPLYEHLGFLLLAADEAGHELQAIREAERLRGLDISPRVCMILRRGNEAES